MRLRRRSWFRVLLGLALLFAAYSTLSWVGRTLSLGATGGSSTWLPSKVALAAILLLSTLGAVVLTPLVRERRGGRLRRLRPFDIYRMAALQTADHWMITDAEGVVVEVNPAFEKVTGYTQAEIVGKKPNVIKSGLHDRSFYERMWETLRSGETYRGIVINKRKTGELFYEMKTITPITDSSGRTTHFFSIAKDITELRRAEDELKKTAEEMGVAERIQKRLFPRNSPLADGVDVAGASRPAVVTGGDYFDYLRTPDGDLLLAVGDVSGHGFGPALLMASVRAYIHALTASRVKGEEMLRVLNRLVAKDTRPGDFVTLLLVRADPKTGVCEYASAGHTTGYVLDRRGAVKHRLESLVPPLGLLPEMVLDGMSTFTLDAGELLLLLTDGITEAENRDGRCFGEEGVLRIVRDNRHRSARDIVDLVNATVAEHCGGKLQDDVTSIVLKFGPRE